MRRLAVGLFLLSLPGVPAAAQNFDTVTVRVVPVTRGVAMLVGAGGNLAVAWGDDATFLVDDQFAPLTEKIRAAIATLTNQPVRFVLNTHWHLDHVGGNENLGKAGALIVAHDNVRVRMSTDQFSKFFNRTTPASPKGALPVVTFTDAVTFHLNGDEINAVHIPPAHTDGDALVWFKRANVIHMGDTYFNGRYPFIDLESGGSLEGVIGAADRALGIANDSTRIIPGHGELSNKTELARYRDALVAARDRVKKLIAEGKTLDQIIAAKPMAEYDDRMGKGFINPESFLRTVYTSLGGK
jgi:glyoxylase-like metal-dependent hydrolase (beta-lactamase superfamily II)